ncbi:MAG: DoxX family protein [Gammaproteobacteria bacterium]|nr:DoxX family protein [Gammaproteobacteria bacterium]
MDSLRPHAHWLLRATLAIVFIVHGIGKFMDLGGFSQMMSLSLPIAALVAFAELAGGLGIVAGAFTKDIVTRLAGLAIIPVMLGAIFMVHWGKWSFTPSETHPMGGMEFQVVLLLIALYFVITGNGSEVAKD